MELHLIQKHILRELSKRRSMRYGQLKPPRIEGNQFSYHLKTLITRGYVGKTSTGYKLTTKGLHFATQVNFEHFFVRIQPKIVTLIVCRDAASRYLVYTRSKQPFLGMVGFPYGKIHLGEHVLEAAERELREKTGITADLTQKGMAYLLVTDEQNEVIAHMLCHVFLAKNPQGTAVQESSFGTVQWMRKEELMSNNPMPGVAEVLSMAERKHTTLDFQEYTFELA